MKKRDQRSDRMRGEHLRKGATKCFMTNSMRVILHASLILLLSE